MTTPQARKEFLETLMWKHWGLPYRWGGDDPGAGFDCSGGVQDMLRSLGIIKRSDPRDFTAESLHAFLLAEKRGDARDPEQNFLDLGDLLFFGAAGKITHVAIAHDDDLMFEYGGGGSTTTTEAAAIQQNAFGRFRPILNRNDLVAVIRLRALA